jgi:hypothetical protein
VIQPVRRHPPRPANIARSFGSADHTTSLTRSTSLGCVARTSRTDRPSSLDGVEVPEPPAQARRGAHQPGQSGSTAWEVHCPKADVVNGGFESSALVRSLLVQEQSSECHELDERRLSGTASGCVNGRDGRETDLGRILVGVPLLALCRPVHDRDQSLHALEPTPTGMAAAPCRSPGRPKQPPAPTGPDREDQPLGAAVRGTPRGEEGAGAAVQTRTLPQPAWRPDARHHPDRASDRLEIS